MIFLFLIMLLNRHRIFAQAEITLAVCFLLASDVTRNIAASLAFQFFSLSA